MKAAVVYWSGTGNTAAMAVLVAEGVKEGGWDADIFTSAEFSPSMIDQYDGIAFGCPSMGDEQLEETEFEPMFESCKDKLKGKEVALFGSYGWGDGEWMRNWEDICKSDGALLVDDGVICCNEPDDQASAECRNLGKALAA